MPAAAEGKNNQRLAQVAVKTWTKDEIGDWFDELSQEEEWREASSLLKEAGSKARSLYVSGQLLQSLGADGWSELGLKSPVLQARLKHRLDGGDNYDSRSNRRTTKGIRMGYTINVTTVSGISLVDQTFDCRFVLRSRTLNIASEENKGDPIRTLLGEPVTGDNWEPRIIFMNAIDVRTWRFHWKMVGDGEIEFKYTIEGTFSEPYELQGFPFDVQRLTLRMSSSIPCEVGQDNGEMRQILSFEQLPQTTSVVQVHNFGVSNLYHLSSRVVMTPMKTDVSESSSGTVRPILEMQMTVRRLSMNYIWNFILPLFLIVLMTFSVWAIEVGEIGDRLGVSVTMVLTAIAMKLQVSDKLPSISYTTFIDQYVTTSFVYIFLIVAENSMVMLVDEEEREKVDNICFWIILGVFLLGNLIFLALGTRIKIQSSRGMNSDVASVAADGKQGDERAPLLAP